MSPQEIIDVWKATLEQQRHFNDMSARTRQVGLAFATAGMGLLIVLLQGNAAEQTFIVGAVAIPVASLIPAVIALAFAAVWHLDVGVYHQLQRGAVDFTTAFEALHKDVLGAPYESNGGEQDGMQGLSQSVTRASKQKAISSAAWRIRLFYVFSIGAMLALSVILFFLL